MHIVLVYPPPWKIVLPGQVPAPEGEGPPQGLDAETCLSGDILNIPYGLLSLAAQEIKNGHDINVLNLFSFSWKEIEAIIRSYPARLYGLSCFTANRRGTLLLARLIRKTHPDAHIVVGGPHATALPEEMLVHCDAIDSVVIGEGEETFHEIVQHIEQGKEPAGIAGTASRYKGRITVAPPRSRIEDLDGLSSPFDYFNEYILLTSRGCPWDCTFCCSTALWGRQHRFHSPAYVLDMLERIVTVNGQKAVAVKDETFTGNKAHVLEICRGIEQRNLNFLWSCDTRADVLDEEILYGMRRAGCQRISLGIESGSPEILKTINKNIDLDTVARSTATAKKFGFQVRFYMMAGNRGETRATLQESIDFLQAVQPSQVIFNPFTLLPGTREFEIAEREGRATRELFFTDDFLELQPLARDTEGPETHSIREWLVAHSGLRDVRDYTISERLAVFKLLPDTAAAHLDLAGAYYAAGNLDDAERYVTSALDRDYPLPGLALNYAACIHAKRNNLKETLRYLIKAREAGYHRVVEDNLAAAQEWIRAGGPGSGRPLCLQGGHGFEVTRPKRQPMTPGKIAYDDV